MDSGHAAAGCERCTYHQHDRPASLTNMNTTDHSTARTSHVPSRPHSITLRYMAGAKNKHGTPQSTHYNRCHATRLSRSHSYCYFLRSLSSPHFPRRRHCTLPALVSLTSPSPLRHAALLTPPVAHLQARVRWHGHSSATATPARCGRAQQQMQLLQCQQRGDQRATHKAIERCGPAA